MAYTKHNFQSGATLYAAELNEMDNQIAENEQNIAKAVKTVNGTAPDANGNVTVPTGGGSGSGSDYVLPTASATVKGGVMVGNGLQMDGDVMSVDSVPVDYVSIGKLIQNLWPDNVVVQAQAFYRIGGICLFTYQINVTTTFEGEYGFDLAKLPCATPMRVWLNNSTQFYIQGNPTNNLKPTDTIRVNGERLNAGNYILSGMYPTFDDF